MWPIVKVVLLNFCQLVKYRRHERFFFSGRDLYFVDVQCGVVVRSLSRSFLDEIHERGTAPAIASSNPGTKSGDA